MKKEMQIRNYKMADANLIVVCGSIHHFILRDSADFSNYGVAGADATAFKADITNFEALPTDIELEALKIETTTVKDGLADSMKVSIREIMTRVQTKFGVHHSKYTQFGTVGMDEFDDPHLLICGRRVARTATTYLPDLTSKGLTAVMITALTTLVNSFENAILNQSDAIANRDNATDDRIEMGNALYKKLVDFCETGKSIWVTKDEAKYNDYVIYDTPDGKPPVPIVP